jgi:hypothetical protein
LLFEKGNFRDLFNYINNIKKQLKEEIFMKKLSVILLVIGVLFAMNFTVAAKDSSPGKEIQKIVSINPLGYLFGVINLDYEKVKNNKRTFIIGGTYLTFNSSSWNVSGIGGRVGMQIYKEGNAPHGFYYGPTGSIAYVTAEYTDPYGMTSSSKGTAFSVGGRAGYQWISKENITFNINVGVNYMLGSISAAGQKAPMGGISPQIGTSLGYAF